MDIQYAEILIKTTRPNQNTRFLEICNSFHIYNKQTTKLREKEKGKRKD